RVEWPRPGEWVEWPDAVECREAAEQALWAWIAFGGVGSRTRRGCGTLLCTGNGDGVPDDQLPKHQEIAEEGEAVRVSDEVLDDQPPKHRLASALFRPSGDVARWLTTRLSHPRYVAAPVAGHITTVPMLTGCRISTNTPVGQHMNAWVTAIRPLQQFLQGEKIGRNPKYRDPDRVRRNDSMRPGQSFWPEVGAARAILNAPARKDDYGDVYTKLSPADATGKQFPRTDLGLPRLIKVGSDNGDPVATVERNQQDFTRMASPIILKALPVSATDAVPIAICLTAPHIWDHGSPGLKLKGPGQPGLHLDPHPLNDPNPANRPTWPRALPPHVTDPGVESARDAFMEFVLDDPSWEGWP
ncbi:MAG: RAMP superfamily CRISPR-associated protein, partial [Thermomicrobiales bacterium]